MTGISCLSTPGNLPRPRARRERDGRAEAVAQAGIDDGGQVAGSGQVPFGDRGRQYPGDVQSGQFGGSQGPPQPPCLVAQRTAVTGRQAGCDQSCSAARGQAWSRRPDRVQDREVIGAGHALPVLGGRQELAVPFQDGGQHGQRLARRGG